MRGMKHAPEFLTRRNQRGLIRKGLLTGGVVEDVVYDCCHGREEDAAELVDGYGAEGQGEVGEDNVETH